MTESAPLPTPAEAPPVSPVLATKPGKVGWLALLVAHVALGIALVPQVIPAVPDSKVATLEAEVAQIKQNPSPQETEISAKIAALEAKLAALPQVTGPAELAVLKEQQTAQALNNESAIGNLTAQLSALKGQIKTLEEKLAGGSQSTAQRTVLVAALQLTAAWQQGMAFAAPWQALVSAASADDELDKWAEDAAPVLASWQEKGVPTLHKLTVEFAAAARAELAASAPAGDNFGEKVLRKVQGLVVIRKEGETVVAVDAALDTQLQKAEQALQQGDLTTALATLTAPTTSAALKDWLTRAQARARVDALAQQLVAQSAKYISAELPAAPAAP
jgi:hypothetical protein